MRGLRGTLGSCERPVATGNTRWEPPSFALLVSKRTTGEEKEEEEERRTIGGPPAGLGGGEPDAACDFTNNASFCTTDSGRVNLISQKKKWTLIEPQLYIREEEEEGGEKKM